MNVSNIPEGYVVSEKVSLDVNVAAGKKTSVSVSLVKDEKKTEDKKTDADKVEDKTEDKANVTKDNAEDKTESKAK